MPMTTTPITIEAAPREAIPVMLVGVAYEINPPKAALALKLAVTAKTAGNDDTAMMDALFEWVDIAFGKRASTAIKKRLDDPADDLDLPHITALMEAVIERQTDLPTT